MNHTTNSGASTDTSLYHLKTLTVIALKITSCSVVGVLSLVGNILVIVVVFRVARMKTTTFYLIVNMCIIDILFTLVAMPVFMLQIVDTGLNIGGSVGTFLCKFINPCAFGLMASSVLTMTAIALDRYLAVKRPLQVVMEMKMLKGILISIWTLSFLAVSLPMTFAYKLRQENGTYYCLESWTESTTDNDAISRIYTIILFIIMYLIPFTTMGGLYIVVAHHLWCRPTPGPFHPVRRYLTISRRKVVRMLVAVWICFVVCWLPLQVITLLVFFHDDDIPSGVYFAAEFLTRANGAINPFLYVIFSRVFRKATVKALPMCFKH